MKLSPSIRVHLLHTHLLPIHLILFFTYPFYSLHRHQCNAHKIYSLPPELRLSMRFVSHTVLYSGFWSSSRHCLYTFRLDCTYFYLWNEKKPWIVGFSYIVRHKSTFENFTSGDKQMLFVQINSVFLYKSAGIGRNFFLNFFGNFFNWLSCWFILVKVHYSDWVLHEGHYIYI